MIVDNEHDFQDYGSNAIWVNFQADCIVAGERFDDEPDPPDVIPMQEVPSSPVDLSRRARMLKLGGKILQAFGGAIAEGGTAIGFYWRG